MSSSDLIFVCVFLRGLQSPERFFSSCAHEDKGIYIYIYTYIHTYIHTHTYTYILPFRTSAVVCSYYFCCKQTFFPSWRNWRGFLCRWPTLHTFVSAVTLYTDMHTAENSFGREPISVWVASVQEEASRQWWLLTKYFQNPSISVHACCPLLLPFLTYVWLHFNTLFKTLI